MKWTDPYYELYDKWFRAFAWLPRQIDGELIWWEYYEYKLVGRTGGPFSEDQYFYRLIENETTQMPKL